MASSLQVLFLLSLTSGLFIAGAMSEEAEPQEEEAPAFPPAFLPACPPGWTQLGERCFIFFRQTKFWADAEIECIKIGGNLASIHSSEENHFLSQLVKRVTNKRLLTWVGGSDAIQHRTWFWSDGTEFDYQRWARGEPNNGAGDNCIELNFAGSFWNDRGCASPRPYICAMDVQKTPH